jgi:hypothetical protein
VLHAAILPNDRGSLDVAVERAADRHTLICDEPL